MTTIATDGKSMAGDGQRECRGIITTRSAEKVRRLNDGSILGTAGDSAFGVATVDWLNGGERPSLGEPESGFSALLLKPSGELLLYDKHFIGMPVEVPFAIGSGMDIAIGAMLAGASPKMAVEIAALKDPGTGGEITVIERTIRAVA